jgi:hypothetical protein
MEETMLFTKKAFDGSDGTYGYRRMHASCAAIVTTRLELSLADAERRVQARLASQRALSEDRAQPPQIHVLLDESCIRHQQRPGPHGPGAGQDRRGPVRGGPLVRIIAVHARWSPCAMVQRYEPLPSR